MSAPLKASRKRGGKGISRGEKIAGLVVVVLAIWVVYSVTQPSPPPTTTTTTPTTTTSASGAPDFTLPVVSANGLTGQKVSLSSFRGKVVFLEFMEPWCSHCQTMAPVLENLYQQYGPQNVVFLTVSGPWNGANANDAASFIRDYHSSWIYVYDSSGTTFNAYGVQATPTFFLIDKNGQVARTYQGEVAAETIASDITRLNT
jgi:cytochrome c-type biogenesis protein